jgi:hypothetical protein
MGKPFDDISMNYKNLENLFNKLHQALAFALALA